ncbi:MAG: SpoIIE family protein phosphatase [Candidatus Kapabacteria bacterium]|jgi:serine phosphatase RsbU (regulator of sigma subunit)|nr:SpoIIE family protein phosphatase [Candidatus Kapabacteria bacterium]
MNPLFAEYRKYLLTALLLVLLLASLLAPVGLFAGDDYGERSHLKVNSDGVISLTPKDLTGTANPEKYFIGVWHPTVWRYLQDDKPEFASQHLDDAHWRLVKNNSPEEIKPDWNRVFWLRSHIRIDSSLRYAAIALLPRGVGAAEYYLNGRLVAVMGHPSNNPSEEVVISARGKPAIMQFGGELDNVLAVRYSFHRMPVGFAVAPSVKSEPFLGVRFAPIEDALALQRQKESFYSVRYLVAIGMMLALGLLHIALFAFNRTQRFHWLYALFTFLVALRFLTVYMENMSEPHPGVLLFFNFVPKVYNNLIPFVCWLFFYALFAEKLSRRRLRISAGLTFAVIIGLFITSSSPNVYHFVYDVSMVVIILQAFDAGRITIRALRRNEAGAGLMLFGIADFGVMWTIRWITMFSFFSWKISQNAMETFVYVGYMSVPLAMSLYIALVVSRTQRKLEEQIVHVQELSERTLEQERQAKEAEISRKLLEADNERKTRELEEARTLQLSMLPSKLPDHPRYEMAAFMRTATEVGGDYYDFRYAPESGALVAAIGDATGHGMKAGYLVSTTKSYFQTLAISENGSGFLAKLSDGIKNMNLRGMYMCLALVRCLGSDVHIAIAGMPPVLIYRAATRKLEQICVKALPLGSVSNFEYREVITSLEAGDVILLMTDGLPELFNEHGEMLDYSRIEECFLANAERSPIEIVNALKTCAEAWLQKATLLDDMTFVALKMKSSAAQNAFIPTQSAPLQQSTRPNVLTSTIHSSRKEAAEVLSA